jgi:hypothetical protein
MLILLYLISVYNSIHDLEDLTSTQELTRSNLTNENSKTQLIQKDSRNEPNNSISYREDEYEKYEPVHNCFVTCCSFPSRVFYTILVLLAILTGIFLCVSGYVLKNAWYSKLGGIILGAGIIYTIIMLGLYKFCEAKSGSFYGIPIYV